MTVIDSTATRTMCRRCAAFLHEDESGYGYCARFGRFTHYSRLCDGEQAGRRRTAANPATANARKGGSNAF